MHLLIRTLVDDRSGDGGGGQYGEAFIAECRDGDRAAQKRLFDLLAPKMKVLCKRYVGDDATAEDILQEGFITLFTRLDSYSGTGSFEGWARKIFVNTALMHLRRNDALRDSGDIEEAVWLRSDDVSPSGQLSHKELLKMIAALPAEYRTVFNMYVIEGYSHQEIADALGIREATSRSKLQRARLKLQEWIKSLS